MASLPFITGFALLVMETFTGMVANGFIALINCIDWFKSRKQSPTDLILTCLSLSRLTWQAAAMLHVITFSFFLPTSVLNLGRLIVTIMLLFTNELNLWFAAWLSVLYLVKIATFSHAVFLQAKLRFSGLVPWLLLSSVLFSASITIIFITDSSRVLGICDAYKPLSTNSCDSETEMPDACKHFVIAMTVPNLIPSVIFVSSTVLLIASLWRHIRHLQHNGTGVRDLNTNVHLTAIKALASFAVLHLSGFVAIILQTVLVWRSNYSWSTVFFLNVSSTSPFVHAVILILINPRLKQAWVAMIHHFKMFFEGRTILKSTRRI